MNRRRGWVVALLAMVLAWPATVAWAAISGVSSSPAANAAGTADVTVTWTQSQDCDNGQVWYWDNDPGHGTSHFATATESGTGPYTWSATIPGQPAGTVVEYQVQNWGNCSEEYDTNGGRFYGYGASASTTQTYHTVHVNSGGADLVDWRANENLGSASSVTYYLTWDASYFYVGFSGGNVHSDKYTIFFDTSPTQNTGATAGFGGASFPANGAPDYAVQWRGSSSDFWFATGSGGGWTGAAESSNWSGDLYGTDDGGSPGAVELRIARGKVGLSSTSAPFGVYLIASNSSDQLWSAFPSNNPQTNPANLTTALYFYASKDSTAPTTAGLRTPFSGVTWTAGDGSTNWVEHTHQRKVTYVNGKWWVVYRNGTGTDIRARSSSDGGVTWSSEISVTNSASSDRVPTMWVEGNTLHLAWLNTGNALYYNTINTADSTLGTRRTVATPVVDGSESVALMRGSDGTLWIAANAASIYRSTDGGATWGQSPNPPANLADLGTSYYNAALLLPLPNGRVMAIAAQTNRNYDYSVWDGAVGWTAWAALNPMANEGVSARNAECSGGVDSAGNAYFVHVSDTGTSSGTPDTLRVYRYAAATGTWTQRATLTVSGSDTMHFPALAINYDDALFLAYRQATNDTSNFALYRRTSADGGATWSSATLAGYVSSATATFYDIGINQVSDRFLGLLYRDRASSPITPQFTLVDIFTAPRLPVQLSLADSVKVTSTVPSFTFSAVDPGRDDVRYNIQLDDDPAFGSPLDRTSGTDAGFANLTTPADTDPFNSADTVQFIVPGGDALANGTTYYWRVRALDPSPGSAYWSGWSPVRSFTVDTALDVGAWFQGEQGQFATWDCRSNALATSDDRVRAGTRSTVSVSAGDDDSYDDGGNNRHSDPAVCFGHWEGNDHTAGLIFRALPIQTAESPYVDSALVQLTVPGAVSYPPPVDASIGAEDDSDGVVDDFHVGALLPSARTLGTALASWSIRFYWENGAVVNSPELRSVVQEVVARSGWGSGDDLDIIIRNNGTTGDNHMGAVSQNGGTAPRLYTTYVSDAASGALYSAPAVLSDAFGSGSWGEVYWHEWEPGAANVHVHLYYRQSDGTLAIVPDAALAGNSTGFERGFVDINALNTSTYGTLLLKADLTVASGAASPSLWQWAVTRHTDAASSMAVSWHITTDTNRIYTFGEAGLRLAFAGDPPDSACDIQVTVYRNTQHPNAGHAANRYYGITTPGGGTACSGFTADLVLGYTTSELNGNNEANLHAYRRNGTVWDDWSGTVDTNANTVSVSGVTAFSDWMLDEYSPTAVRLLAFAARPAAGGVLLTWETASEHDNAGFHLYRSVSLDTRGERLNGALIPAATAGGEQGASYAFLDRTAQPGVNYCYTLEDVDVSGTRTPHGPAVVTLWQAYLPLVGH